MPVTPKFKDTRHGHPAAPLFTLCCHSTNMKLPLFAALLTAVLACGSVHEALASLYGSLRGEDWTVSAGWGTDEPLCTWYGVSCDDEGNVRALDLRSNRLVGHISEAIACLPHLEVLDVSDNEVLSISPSIVTLEALNTLNLAHNNISELPFGFGEASVTMLDVSHNRLKELSHTIGSLPLIDFAAEYNLLTSLPESFCELSALQWCDLSSNRLTELPECFGQLSSLTLLYLTDNDIVELPSEFGKLSALTSLHMQYNNVKKLPPTFGELANLRTAFLSQNYVEAFPDVVNMADLRRLRMNNNCMGGSPPAFLMDRSEMLSLEMQCTYLVDGDGFSLHHLRSLNGAGILPYTTNYSTCALRGCPNPCPSGYEEGSTFFECVEEPPFYEAFLSWQWFMVFVAGALVFASFIWCLYGRLSNKRAYVPHDDSADYAHELVDEDSDISSAELAIG